MLNRVWFCQQRTIEDYNKYIGRLKSLFRERERERSGFRKPRVDVVQCLKKKKKVKHHRKMISASRDDHSVCC